MLRNNIIPITIFNFYTLKCYFNKKHDFVILNMIDYRLN